MCGEAVVKRLANCGDCGASVVLTSAAPVVRAGAVVLLCDACRGDDDGQRADYEAYEAIVVADSTEDSSEYEAISVSGGDDLPAADGRRPQVVDSSHAASASGSIDSDSKDGSTAGSSKTR